MARAQIGQLISSAMARVGRQGVVTMEESRTAEDNLYVVEGMQFDRGYISPYFVTDPERMVRGAPAPAGLAQMPGGNRNVFGTGACGCKSTLCQPVHAIHRSFLGALAAKRVARCLRLVLHPARAR